MARPLSQAQLKAFRGQGHTLQPVVIVGKENLNAPVLKAIDAALTTHELIKVKLLQSVALDKDNAAQQICEATGATLIQRVGRVALIHRPRPDDTKK